MSRTVEQASIEFAPKSTTTESTVNIDQEAVVLRRRNLFRAVYSIFQVGPSLVSEIDIPASPNLSLIMSAVS